LPAKALRALPVGLLRRIIGMDSMQLNCWKKGHESVFRARNQRVVAKDLKLTILRQVGMLDEIAK
jgi:hypothetical protein